MRDSAYTLLDGSALRTPGFGVFGARGQNLESYGVPPDIWVDNGPADFLTGYDRQAEKAVEVLNAVIKYWHFPNPQCVRGQGRSPALTAD